MSTEYSVILAGLIIIALVATKMLSAKHEKKLAARQKIMEAESALLREADAIVSDETISEDELYEKTKEIYEKLQELKSSKAKI
ncbi:MAG: hypothetical protein ACRD5H_07310 [Nitrososphaerales archaeon]